MASTHFDLVVNGGRSVYGVFFIVAKLCERQISAGWWGHSFAAICSALRTDETFWIVAREIGHRERKWRFFFKSSIIHHAFRNTSKRRRAGTRHTGEPYSRAWACGQRSNTELRLVQTNTQHMLCTCFGSQTAGRASACQQQTIPSQPSDAMTPCVLVDCKLFCKGTSPSSRPSRSYNTLQNLQQWADKRRTITNAEPWSAEYSIRAKKPLHFKELIWGTTMVPERILTKNAYLTLKRKLMMEN